MLVINSRDITSAGIAYLPNLQIFHIKDNEKVDDSALENLTNLTELKLHKTVITDNGIADLTILKSLEITNNSKITDCGIEVVYYTVAIKSHPNAPNA